MRPLENRAGANGEIFLALVAQVETFLALARRNALGQTATRAARTLRPQAGFEVHPRGFLIREHLEKLEGADGDFVVHGQWTPFMSRDYPSKRLWSQVYNSQKISHFSAGSEYKADQ